MNIFSPEEEARLLKLLGEETTVLKQIREMTLKQMDLLESGEIERLGEALDDRQGLIEQIKGLHQETNVLMQSYVTVKKAPGGKSIAAVESASSVLWDTMEETEKINRRITVAAKGAAEDFIRQIGKLSLMRKSMKKYAPELAGGSELLDIKT